MLIPYFVAAVAIAAMALAPRRRWSAVVIVAAATVDLLLGDATVRAMGPAVPLFAFVAAALTLARLVERAGLAERAARILAVRARGDGVALYTFVCILCAALTAMVSLDGAVILMVPVLVSLSRRWGAPFAPLFLGTVVVANAASIVVPQGNPTNLIVMDRLGLSAGAFAAHMFLPGLGAAVLCAVAVGIQERRTLSAGYRVARVNRRRLMPAERRAAAGLTLAAVAGWVAPLLGLAPWWPFAGAVGLTLLADRGCARLVVPSRLAIQSAGLLVAVGALRLSAPAVPRAGLTSLVVVALGVGLAAALANNLPVGISAASLLAPQTGYAASIGLALGAMATPHGSIATLVAGDVAGRAAPSVSARRLAPIAVASVALATVLLCVSD